MIDQLDVHNFLEVFRKFNGQIYGYIYLRTGRNKAVAEDLAQEIFTKAWQNRKRFDARKASIKTWLYTIAHNSVIDHWRKVSIDTVAISESNQASSSEMDKTEAELMTDYIHKQLHKLEHFDQDLLTWRYIQELEIEEIAQIINKNYNTTKVAIYRALQKLKKLINDE